MYHLNRVHSKIVFLNSKYNGIIQDDLLMNQKNGLENLKNFLICLFPNSTNKILKDYIQSINQFMSAISNENRKEMFLRSCYMQGCFSRFRKDFLNNYDNYCQYKFDMFCLPLFTLEIERKKIKLERMKNENAR